jgi:hypothetical protein
LVWYIDGSKTKSLVLGCVDGGWRNWHNFSLGLQTTVFQAEIYAFKACGMGNIENGYTGTFIFFQTVEQSLRALTIFT